jgi:hypothetical protein
MSVADLRKQILRHCDVIQSLLAFNYHLAAEDKGRLDEIRRRLPARPKPALQEMLGRLEQNEAEIASTFGCLMKPSRFASEFMENCLPPPKQLSISKATIDTKYFSRFCEGHPFWNLQPAHLQLFVDYDLVVPANGVQEFHYFLPEAILYEDMALAYNEANNTRRPPDPVRDLTPDVNAKKHNMFCRTAVLGAFYFVEAYLNGLAFDYWYRHKDKLTRDQADCLLEWDSHSNRQKLVSFERKIMDYPKIILGTKHPPLTTTNSGSLRVLLGEAKECRDAIVHQSPKMSDPDRGAEKVRLILELTFEAVTETVDGAVGFVGELNDAVDPHGMLLHWLVPRSSEQGGKFPPEAFV